MPQRDNPTNPGDSPALDVQAAVKLREAVSLHREGQLARARTIYEDILRIRPRHFDALHLLGVIAAMTDSPRNAVGYIRRAIAVDPQNPHAHNNLGTALQESGEWEAALSCFERAISLKSDYAEPYFNRGNLFRNLGRMEESLADYDAAIARRSDHAEAYSNRGIVLAGLGRLPDAVASYDRAIQLRGSFADAHFNRANALCALGRWDEALAAYDRVLALRSDHADAHANRGFVLYELQRHEESLASCDRAIACRPQYAEAYCNRGSVLMAMRRLPEALVSYDRAIENKPDHARGRANRAVALLLSGDYQRGWAEHEWRWNEPANPTVAPTRRFSQPVWLGQSSLVGKSILLYCEQGYGDSLQFCRYVELVADLGARVILEVPTALSALLATLPGVAELVVQGDPLPAVDYVCPLLSLPLALKTTLSTIPARVPYLEVTQERLQFWHRKLGARGRRRVGLVWSGGFRPHQPEWWSVNERRNLPLALLQGLRHPEVDFYSLQKGRPAEDDPGELAARDWGGPKIIDFTADIDNFADTAALIQQLDLIISVDTSTAHLAGALGKPVWILNRYDACWRWLLDRDDSPWYPTARLYRQDRPGDWRGLLRRLEADFTQWVAQSVAPPMRSS